MKPFRTIRLNRGSRLGWAGVGMVVALAALTSCQKEKPAAQAGSAPRPAAAAQPAPPPSRPSPPPAPPAPPQTSLGKLVKIERSNKAAIEAMSLHGMVASDLDAGKGRTFVVLRFEGKGRAQDDELADLVAVEPDNVMSRADTRSWLTDAQGKKYTPGLLARNKRGCQLSFATRNGATGLVWHDGKQKSYQLEPQLVEIRDQAGAPAVQR